MAEGAPEWQVETTSDFNEDYAALAVVGGEQLERFRESCCFYLHRNPVVMATGLLGPMDDASRVMTYADADLGVEYVVGLSIDRTNHLVWVRWLDSREFEPDYS